MRFLSALPTLLLGSFFYNNNWHLINFDLYLPLFLFGCFILTYLWNKFFINRSRVALNIPFTVVFSLILAIGIFYESRLHVYFPFILLSTIVLSFILYFDKGLKLTKVFFSVLVLSNIFSIGYKAYNSDAFIAKINAEYNEIPVKHKFTKTPNVYYLVPDAYPSKKSMDNDGITDDVHGRIFDFLKNEGFSVYNNAYSNYGSSYLSMASTLTMKHMGVVKHSAVKDDLIVTNGKNGVVKTFIKNGYDINIWGKSISDTDSIGIFTKRTDLSSFVYYIRIGAILLALQNNILKDNKKFEPYFYTNLKNIRTDKPLFAYLHSVQAHGNVIDCIDNKDNYYNLIGHRQQISCVSNDIKKAVHYINENDPNAIIIIQADHGSSIGYLFKHYNHNYEQEIIKRFGIIFAVRWPNECKYLGKEKFTPVNLFPRVFACLSGKKPDYANMQPNNSYMLSQYLKNDIDINSKIIRVIKNNRIIAPFAVQ